MPVTALDLSQRQFQRVLRGYSPKEVHAVVAEAAAALEALALEVQGLRDQVGRRGDEVEGYKGRERMLHQTLLTAQKACDDIRESARREADVVVADAELQADKIVASANNRLVELIRELNELKRQKVQFESHLEALVDSHKKLLDSWKTQPGGEVAYLVKK